MVKSKIIFLFLVVFAIFALSLQVEPGISKVSAIGNVYVIICPLDRVCPAPVCQYDQEQDQYIRTTFVCNFNTNNCTATDTPCEENQICSNGQCQNIICSTDSDCGEDYDSGFPYCQGDDVYQNRVEWTCNNPGTINSNCTSSSLPRLITDCANNQVCRNASCVAQGATCSGLADCPLESYRCDGTGKSIKTTYACESGVCTPHESTTTCATAVTSCDANKFTWRDESCMTTSGRCEWYTIQEQQCDGTPVAVEDPKRYSCDPENPANIMQLFEKEECDVINPANPCKAVSYWGNTGTRCGGKGEEALNNRCTPDWWQEFHYSVCRTTTVDDCAGDDASESGHCGTCDEYDSWDKGNCTNSCVFAFNAPQNERCGQGLTPLDASGIERNFICRLCEAGKEGGCDPKEKWMPVLGCGWPHTATTNFCSGDVQCTLTTSYKGECFYWPPNSNIVGGCRAPTVEVQCGGPCVDNGNVENNEDNRNTCNANKQCVAGGGGAVCGNDNDCKNLQNQCNANKQCVAGGGGAVCANNAACQVLGGGCDANNQCVPGGVGPACDDENDCQPAVIGCNANKQCVAGGGGGACANNANCVALPTQCNANAQCVPGGGGNACNVNADCQAPQLAGCDANDKCVLGGGGGACANDADCAAQPNQCNPNKQCVPGGGGVACANDAACQVPQTCNANKQCVAGGGGANCNNDGDCQNMNSCNANNQCVPGGGGVNCDPANGNIECQGAQNQCNANGQCVPGGGGVNCDPANGNADCQNCGCNINKQCVAGGGGLPCFASLDCQFLQTSCNIFRQCVAGGGGANCSSNSDCQGSNVNMECNFLRQCVPGGGGGSCASSSDCQIPFSKCQITDNQCKCVVDYGLNINECSDASDCPDPSCEKHGECDIFTQKCELKNGPAPIGITNGCKTDTDCAPGHNECQEDAGGFKCVSVDTPGMDQCPTPGLECPSLKHTECDGEVCVLRDGVLPEDKLGCTSSEDCKDNLPPYAENLQVLSGDYCSELVNFRWTYKDKELCDGTSNDTEKMYRFQVSTNSAFNGTGIVIDKIVSTSALGCGAANVQTIPVLPALTSPNSSCKPNCTSINYGVPYYWRVMVWENITGKKSSWISYNDTDNSDDADNKPLTYTHIWGHPAPMVVYSPLSYDLVKIFPAPGEEVYFADTSTCFDKNGRSYPCKCHNTEKRSETNCLTISDGGLLDINLNNCYGGQCYAWNFSESNLDPATSSEMGDVTHRYGTVKPSGYLSSLQICDDLGCCTAYENIPVKNKSAQELPQWKEISPF